MNFPIVLYMLGWIMFIVAGLMSLPLAVALLYGETGVVLAFAISIAVSAAIGFLLVVKKPRNRVFHLREGFVITALSWICMSLVGALPFMFSGCCSNFIDAFFETVSGFTTTGASIFPEVESLPYGILFWRSFTHWIGGMGVLVFLLSLIPLSGGSNMNLMKAESPGPQVGKLVPKVKSTAKILYRIYFGITVLEIIFLLFGGMNLFEAATTTFGTVGTGGFGIKNDSIASYSTYIQVVITVFMILSGVNFNAYFFLVYRKFRKAFEIEEVRVYLLIILSSVTLITINICHMYDSVWKAIQQAFFQVGTIITTTGFATTDFDTWPLFSKSILVLLMFIGACAGSTGGGIKVSRVILLFKSMKKEFKTILHPQSVGAVLMDKKRVQHEVMRSTNVFMVAYIFTFIISFLIVALDNFDYTTSFTAVAATLNNIGPGLSGVGPSQNFGFFSDLSKIVMSFDMLAGRLELFPMILLFSRNTWQRF